MNHWTSLSIELANQRDYLDQLFRVYPMAPDTVREVDSARWSEVEAALGKGDNTRLVRALLGMPLFPIKDSYVAYLKRDPDAIERNPETINRLAGRLRDMGKDQLWARCSEPKETNRQIGPLFRRWIRSGALGVPTLPLNDFLGARGNAVLDAGDEALRAFAGSELGHAGTKGLDFVGRFNGRFVVAEAKFITDFGGRQNAQFGDALALFRGRGGKSVRVAVLDGVLYIPGKHRLHGHLGGRHDQNILSALLLRDFLFQL